MGHGSCPQDSDRTRPGRARRWAHPRCLAAAILALLLLLTGCWRKDDRRLTLEADGNFLSKKWAESSELYEQLVERRPNDGTLWFRLGTCRMRLKQYDKAIGAFSRAESLQFARGSSLYNLTIAYAQLGKPDEAIDALKRALTHGFEGLHLLKTEPLLSPIRSDARFQQIVTELDKVDRASRGATALNWWVGRWQVYPEQGGEPFAATVEREPVRSTIVVRWELPGRPMRVMFFHYFQDTDSWLQVYTGDNGEKVRRSGGREGYSLVLHRKVTLDGKQVEERLTIRPERRRGIRYLLERQGSGSGQWQTVANYLHVRPGTTTRPTTPLW